MQPRDDIRRTPTFIEEEDRGGTRDYDSTPTGNSDGFAPRNSNPMEDRNAPVDPLDQTFGATADGETLRFKIPTSVLDDREPAPTHQTEKPEPKTERIHSKDAAPEYPLLKLDEKITSKPVQQRTRLVRRTSWTEPVLARRIPQTNENWVAVPMPTQLVQK